MKYLESEVRWKELNRSVNIIDRTNDSEGVIQMSRVAVNQNILFWALGRSGKTVEELQKPFPKINRWLEGDSDPTLKQLEKLARATLTPFGFFFLQSPPEENLPIPHFRTLEDKTKIPPSPNLIETIYTMQRRQDWMREYLIDEGQETLPFVNSVKISKSTIDVAQYIKQVLGLEEGWASECQTWEYALRCLRESIERAGILVVTSGIVGNNTHRALDVNEFRGFVLVDQYAPLMFINGADYKAAQMFTLAHELAHVFFGRSAAFDLGEMQPADDQTESVCNRVAAEFLVPESELRKIWPSVRKEQNPYKELARKFKVSELVVARRLLDLELIKRNEFYQFYQEYMKIQRKLNANRKPGGDSNRNQSARIGRRFASMVIQATKEGRLLYSEAYRLTGLYGSSFEKYARFLEKSVR